MTEGLRRLIFLTGRPGVGKTSVLLRAVDILQGKGFEVGGMISREIREQGVRVGFEIMDLQTGAQGWLAHVDQPTGPRISKYRVNLSDLNNVGAGSILRAVEKAHIVVVDEIGPMELVSSDFKDAVMQGVESRKVMTGTIHYTARDPLIDKIKAHEDSEVFEVTRQNRSRLHTLMVGRVLQHLENQS
ncbi:NTPase [Candidatus Bathyarchaeota archaeon]|nr:NTPase [Desulfobacterales bacterium]NIU81732.1 NTPase [Candidatus Bathyarchaeota archaeon]NIV68368.1 NTPase [Candidatus Bathyarchaeota archaeon]NIW16682.1 NTPase [Candidatus Bathyarchaeota archaeon]